MSTGNHLEIVGVVELLSDILSEGVARTSRVHAPSCPIVRVTPEQIAHRSLVWDFLETFKSSDVVKCFDAGGKTSMQAEELVLYYGG